MELVTELTELTISDEDILKAIRNHSKLQFFLPLPLGKHLQALIQRGTLIEAASNNRSHKKIESYKEFTFGYEHIELKETSPLRFDSSELLQDHPTYYTTKSDVQFIVVQFIRTIMSCFKI